jgi:hypothetical protein
MRLKGHRLLVWFAALLPILSSDYAEAWTYKINEDRVARFKDVQVSQESTDGQAELFVFCRESKGTHDLSIYLSISRDDILDFDVITFVDEFFEMSYGTAFRASYRLDATPPENIIWSQFDDTQFNTAVIDWPLTISQFGGRIKPTSKAGARLQISFLNKLKRSKTLLISYPILGRGELIREFSLDGFTEASKQVLSACNA